MGSKSLLLAGLVPGIKRQPRKQLSIDPERLLTQLYRWRDEAVKAAMRSSGSWRRSCRCAVNSARMDSRDACSVLPRSANWVATASARVQPTVIGYSPNFPVSTTIARNRPSLSRERRRLHTQSEFLRFLATEARALSCSLSEVTGRSSRNSRSTG